MRLIKLLQLLPLALVLVLPGVTYAQGWIKYVNEEDQFIVNFPGEPELLQVDYITEAGATIPSRIYSVENGDRRYAITVVDYSMAEEAHVARCRRLEVETGRVSPNQCSGNGHFRDIDGSVAFEAANIRRRSSGEITYDQKEAFLKNYVKPLFQIYEGKVPGNDEAVNAAKRRRVFSLLPTPSRHVDGHPGYSGAPRGRRSTGRPRERNRESNDSLETNLPSAAIARTLAIAAARASPCVVAT